jgi:hypothetical protein
MDGFSFRPGHSDYVVRTRQLGAFEGTVNDQATDSLPIAVSGRSDHGYAVPKVVRAYNSIVIPTDRHVA